MFRLVAGCCSTIPTSDSATVASSSCCPRYKTAFGGNIPSQMPVRRGGSSRKACQVGVAGGANQKSVSVCCAPTGCQATARTTHTVATNRIWVISSPLMLAFPADSHSGSRQGDTSPAPLASQRRAGAPISSRGGTGRDPTMSTSRNTSRSRAFGTVATSGKSDRPQGGLDQKHLTGRHRPWNRSFASEQPTPRYPQGLPTLPLSSSSVFPAAPRGWSGPKEATQPP